MSNLKNQLIRLGDTNPNLRQHLTPILDALHKTSAWDDMHPFEKAKFDLNQLAKDLDIEGGLRRVVGRDFEKTTGVRKDGASLFYNFTWPTFFNVKLTKDQDRHQTPHLFITFKGVPYHKIQNLNEQSWKKVLAGLKVAVNAAQDVQERYQMSIDVDKGEAQEKAFLKKLQEM